MPAGDVNPLDRPPPSAARPASLVARAVARVVDSFVLSMPLAVVAYVLRSGSSRLTAAFLVYAVVAAYEVPLTAVRGRTIGKATARCAVIALDGAPPGWVRSAVRWGVMAAVPVLLDRLLPTGPSTVVSLACVFGPALVDDERRGLHDRVAGTRVVVA